MSARYSDRDGDELFLSIYDTECPVSSDDRGLEFGSSEHLGDLEKFLCLSCGWLGRDRLLNRCWFRGILLIDRSVEFMLLSSAVI